MARHIVIMLLLAIQCMRLHGATRFEKFERRPYGPKMCTEWCKNAPDSFLYSKEELCCRRIPAKDTNFTKTKYSFACWINKARTNSSIPLAVSPVHNTCDAPLEGDLENNPNKSLHQACMEGNLCRVEYILSKRLADINCRGRFGRTPVMVAARHGQVAVLEYLVSQGCDLASADKTNNTLLHIACIGGFTEIVRKLVTIKHIDIDGKGRYGWGPVMMAVFAGHTDVFDLLVSKGCNLSISGEYHYNILHIASAGGHVNMVKHILSRCMYHIDSTSDDGVTPLLTAVEKGHIKVFDFLVNRGCNVNSLTMNKRNALHVACFAGKEEMVRHILSQDMYDIESRDINGQTPVMHAARKGYVAVADLVIDKGCNLEVIDDDTNNILHVACIGGHVEMVEHIISQHIVGVDSKGFSGQTAVIMVVRQGYIKVVELLVSKGCDLHAIDKSNNNVFHVACHFGHADIVEYFLSHGAPDAESRGLLGLTPLLTAAKHGHKRVFIRLVDAGCSVSAVDDYNNNIYHLACFTGHVDIVKYFLSQGISGKDNKGYKGMTPIMVAEKFGHKELVKIMASQ